jgi:hypothetical protein
VINFAFTAASSDRLEGRIIVVHITPAQITALVDRDHVDPAILPGLGEASNKAFGNWRIRATPIAEPVPEYHVLADIPPSAQPFIDTEPAGFTHHLPRDSVSPEFIRCGSLIATSVMRYLAPPANFVLPPPPTINGPDLLAKEAS